MTACGLRRGRARPYRWKKLRVRRTHSRCFRSVALCNCCRPAGVCRAGHRLMRALGQNRKSMVQLIPLARCLIFPIVSVFCSIRCRINENELSLPWTLLGETRGDDLSATAGVWCAYDRNVRNGASFATRRRSRLSLFRSSFTPLPLRLQLVS